MKKLVILVLVFTFLLSAAACGNISSDTSVMETTAKTTAPTVENPACTEAPVESEKMPIFDYAAAVLTANGEVSPYASSMYWFLDGRIFDGVLMFYRTVEMLPEWKENGLIPMVALDENAVMQFTCGEHSKLTHSGRFNLYTENEDGTFSNVYTLENSTLADVYTYGRNHLAGQTVYITCGCIVCDAENENDRHEIVFFFCTEF